MKLVPHDKTKLGTRGFYAKTSNLKILEGFAESGYDCVKLEDYPHRDAYTCCGSLKQSIKRFNFGTIACIVRGGEVYLIKK